MIDDNFTRRLERWLQEPEHATDDDIMQGAMLLLQLSRNRQLYQTVSTNPKRFLKTVEYELRKFLPSRKRGETMEDVERQRKATLAELKAAGAEMSQDGSSTADSLPTHGGRRADHGQLPPEIQQIWTEQADRWKKIKQLYNTCLHTEQPCDLAEQLHVLKETWYRYKQEFQRYDNYVAVSAEDQPAEAPSPKALTNARSYISKQLRADRLMKLRQQAQADGATPKAVAAYRDTLTATQQRVDLLLRAGEPIGPELQKKLAACGILGVTS